MRRIARSAIVETTAQAFYGLVEDIESYPQFLPWCAAASVLSRAPGKTVAKLTLKLKGVRQSFTTENLNVPGQSIEMRLIEGPFRHFSAQWRFGPLGERACKAEFSLAFEFSSRILAATLGPLFERMADETVDAFVRRAREGETAR
jgi:ribosome-associated toxin RatA of RatAB toxin-antitoxin module